MRCPARPHADHRHRGQQRSRQHRQYPMTTSHVPLPTPAASGPVTQASLTLTNWVALIERRAFTRGSHAEAPGPTLVWRSEARLQDFVRCGGDEPQSWHEARRGSRRSGRASGTRVQRTGPGRQRSANSKRVSVGPDLAARLPVPVRARTNSRVAIFVPVVCPLSRPEEALRWRTSGARGSNMTQVPPHRAHVMGRRRRISPRAPFGEVAVHSRRIGAPSARSHRAQCRSGSQPQRPGPHTPASRASLRI